MTEQTSIACLLRAKLYERLGWWAKWADGETPSPLSADLWPDERRALL